MAEKNKHISHVKSNLTVNTYVNKATGAVVSEEFYNNQTAEEKANYRIAVGPKLPTTSDILYGELAVNYADGYETIAIKNSTNEIAQFKSEEYNENKYATKEYVDSVISSSTKYKGGFNASTGAIDDSADTLTSIAENVGDMYTVTTAGTYAGTALVVGDTVIFKNDVAAGVAPQASDLTFVQGGVTVDNKNATLSLNSAVTVATVAGTNINVSLPKNDIEGLNTDVTKVKVGNTTLSADNDSEVVTFAGDSNLDVSADSNTKTVSVGVKADSDLAGLISDASDLADLADMKSDISDIVDMKTDISGLVNDASDLSGLADVADILEAIANASGADGVLKKETTEDPVTHETTVTWIIQDKGTSGDLTTGTSTDAKPWDAKTLTEYIASVMANATEFKGGFNASTGAIDGGATTLTTVAEKIGDVYTATTAGTFAGTVLEVGDSIIFKTAVAAGTAVQASDVIFVEGTVSVSSEDTTLAWDTLKKIATVEGTEIKVKLPQDPVANNQDLQAIIGMKSDLAELTNGNVSDTLADMANASGANGVLTKTTNGDTVTWSIAAVQDEKVKQSNTVENASYRVLLSNSANNNEETNGVKKSANLTFNPNLNTLTVNGLSVATINGGSVPSSDAKFTDTTYTFANGTSTSGVGTFKVTPSSGSAQTVTVYGVQGQVGALGSSTEPLYTSAAGTFATCSTYAGGTAVTLNGVDKGASTASFYAPTALGTAGQVLKTNSGATAVEWGTLASSDLPSNIVYNTLVNNVTISSSTPSIPVANRVVEANVTSDADIRVAAQSTTGAEIHVILSNTSGTDYTLVIPHGVQSTIDYYNTVDAAQGSLVCAAGSKHELNFLFGSISSGVQTVYVRYA